MTALCRTACAVLFALVCSSFIGCSADTPALSDLGEGRRAGDCSDGADNDGDGAFDCNDEGCRGAPVCGAAPGSDGGAPMARQDAGRPPSGGSFECCLNGAGYRCPSEAAFTQCVGFDVDGCLAACNPADFECPANCFDMVGEAEPDPSACTADPTATCDSPSSCSPGVECTLDSHCSSGNCTSGRCYGNDRGCMCSLDSHCSSRNCTSGTCQGNDGGEGCTLDSHCTSRNCTGGECHGNSRGDACSLDSHCTSRNCTGGRYQ